MCDPVVDFPRFLFITSVALYACLLFFYFCVLPPSHWCTGLGLAGLQQACKCRGLPVYGSKADVKARLLLAIRWDVEAVFGTLVAVRFVCTLQSFCLPPSCSPETKARVCVDLSCCCPPPPHTHTHTHARTQHITHTHTHSCSLTPLSFLILCCRTDMLHLSTGRQ